MAKTKNSFGNMTDGLFSDTTNTENEAQEKNKKAAPVPVNDDDKMIQKAYYITKRHYRKLKIAAAINPDDLDMSAIIRMSLDMYFEKMGI